MRTIRLLLVGVLCNFLISCSNDVSNNKANSDSSRNSVPSISVGQIQIGNQIWMTKNLNVSKYRNGDLIPQVQDPNEFTNLTTGAWCYYNNNPANGNLHGKLYNFYAVTDPRGLAPEGWHIASNQEWTVLINSVGIHAWDKLRAPLMWPYIITSSTNISGFSCMPSGGRFFDEPSGDSYLGDESYIWTSTANNPNEGVYRYIYNPLWNIELSEFASANNGFSVRCIKD